MGKWKSKRKQREKQKHSEQERKMSSNVPVNPRPPKYPVVNPRPTSDEIRANFNGSDYGTMFGLGAVSVPVGYMIGAPKRPATAAVAGAMGLFAGWLMAYQNSAQRLTGLSSNFDEVKSSLDKLVVNEKDA